MEVQSNKLVWKEGTLEITEPFLKKFGNQVQPMENQKELVSFRKFGNGLPRNGPLVNAWPTKPSTYISDNEVVISAKETIVDKTSKRRTETTELEVKTKTISTDSDGTTLKMGKSGVELDTAGFISKAKANQFVGSISVNGSVSSQSV